MSPPIIAPFFSNLINRYLVMVEEVENDYADICQQNQLNPDSRESKVIYACSWIRNNIEILMYRNLYGKECLNDLTPQEQDDFYSRYPAFGEDFVADQSCVRDIVQMLRFLSEPQKRELFNMIN